MMKKSWIISMMCVLGLGSSAFAQTAFWSFDGKDKEALIPAQCDGQFDEARGGVFMPTPQELFEQGEFFLMDKGPNRANAGYCFISAALQGNTDAQFRLAQLYNKGIVLPQDDLSAYKWAFIASLNGHKEAERLALTLESFLSTQDIELATKSIEALLPEIKTTKNRSLSKTVEELEKKQLELAEINKEIDSMLGLPPQKIPTFSEAAAAQQITVEPTAFADKDKYKK